MRRGVRRGGSATGTPAGVEASGWPVLVICATVAGFAARGAGMPAAWLVGPMLVAVLFALVRPEGRPEVPPWARRAAQAVGGVLAATFRPSVLPFVAGEWYAVGLAVGSTVLLSLGASFALARLARLDGRTAALGTLPGAASGMLAMSDALGADPRLVALMQYGRVVLVVASAAVVARLGGSAEPAAGLPGPGPRGAGGPETLIDDAWLVYVLTAFAAVAGGWAGVRLRIPAGGLLGPLFLGVVLEEAHVLSLAWPVGVPQVAYAVIGVHAGLLFDRASVRRAGRLLPFLLASTLSLMVACAGLGLALSALTGTDYLTAYLATTPGGIDSVAIMAVGSGADGSVVVAVQSVRLLAVITAGALFGRRWSSRG